jgi:RES domain-containing protein
MFSAWRIVKRKYLSTAFDGEGAKRWGGRWNHPGTAMVYTSATLSLAALETFVHIDRTDIKFELVAIQVFSTKKIHIDKIDKPHLEVLLKTKTSQDIGSEWIEKQRSPILVVPSFIVSSEFNILLNPNHPHFSRLKFTKPVPFVFDPRMIK